MWGLSPADEFQIVLRPRLPKTFILLRRPLFHVSASKREFILFPNAMPIGSSNRLSEPTSERKHLFGASVFCNLVRLGDSSGIEFALIHLTTAAMRRAQRVTMAAMQGKGSLTSASWLCVTHLKILSVLSSTRPMPPNTEMRPTSLKCTPRTDGCGRRVAMRSLGRHA